MEYLFLEYPACGTCRKARKWLDEHKVPYKVRHIVDERPTAAELKLWVELSGLPLKKFFNTSGLVYKEMGLKDRLSGMSEEEQLSLLASEGKLVKRPLLVKKDKVLVGFDAEKWTVF